MKWKIIQCLKKYSQEDTVLVDTTFFSKFFMIIISSSKTFSTRIGVCSVLGYFHTLVVFVVLFEKSEIFAWRVIFSSLKVMWVNIFPVGNNPTITLDNKHNVWKNQWKTTRIARMFSKAWKYFISTFLLHRKRKQTLKATSFQTYFLLKVSLSSSKTVTEQDFKQDGEDKSWPLNITNIYSSEEWLMMTAWIHGGDLVCSNFTVSISASPTAEQIPTVAIVPQLTTFHRAQGLPWPRGRALGCWLHFGLKYYQSLEARSCLPWQHIAEVQTGG